MLIHELANFHYINVERIKSFKKLYFTRDELVSKAFLHFVVCPLKNQRNTGLDKKN